MELHTTFKRLHEARACKPSYKKLAKKLGGVKVYGQETPINLLTILDILGVDDCLWCLRATVINSDKLATMLSAEFTRSILHVFEKEYLSDCQPSLVAQAVRDFSNG